MRKSYFLPRSQPVSVDDDEDDDDDQIRFLYDFPICTAAVVVGTMIDAALYNPVVVVNRRRLR